MEFERLLHTLTEYGVMMVIAAIFLFLAYRMFKKQDERREALEKQQIEQMKAQQRKNEELFSMLVSALQETPKGHHVDKEEEIGRIEKQINNILKELLFATNAGRAYFVRYHNGGHDLNELSFLKMSMTNEVTRRGVASARDNFSNQFRSMFDWLMDKVATKDIIHINSMSALDIESHTLKDYLDNQGVVRAHGISICNSNKQIIGFIAISYLTSEVFLENDRIEDIVKTAQLKIETLLNFQSEDED